MTATKTLVNNPRKGKGQSRTLVATELGDGLVAFGPAEHGKNSKREDGSKRVAKTFGTARIGDFGKHIKEGKRG